MNITRDTLGHLENPNLILVKASGERVGVLTCTSKLWVKKFNDMDTLSFEIPFMMDGKNTSFYDLIDIMKYIEAPSLGAAFAIKDVSIVNEGQKTEYKKIECQSRECELGQKYLQDFVINTGETGSLDGIKFYQPGDQAHSLLHLILEKLPRWSIGHVDAALYTMQRSFSVTRQDVYSFLMSDVIGAFECVITFDSLNCTINAYMENNYGLDSNVHVSYNNLLENTEMSFSLDEVKTAMVLHGEGDIDIREICMGNDTIYNFSAYASEEYFSASLLSAYNAWINLLNTAVDLNLFTYKTGVITRAELQGKTYSQAFNLLLQKYQDFYTQISKWTNTLMPYGINTRSNPGYGTISYTEDGSDKIIFAKQTSAQLVTSLPSSGNSTVLYLIKNSNNMYRWNGTWVNVNLWNNCCVTELKTLRSGAEKLQATAMKAGYGNPDDTDSTKQARYVDTYLPALYMYNALSAQIKVLTDKDTGLIPNLEANLNIIQTDKTVIVNKTAMRNNFTVAQLKELSAFIREDELTSSNFLVTDTMTEAERFDMLYALLDYGEKELAKVATPQIQFSASLINLFAIPEFDNYSGDFDIGNYVWVTLRDDYSIKAKILEITIDFLDQSNFSVTFGNIMRKARNIFTDVTDALNAATSAATSVSFNSSYWSAAAQDTDSIGKALADGLLSQSYYLANAEDNETLIDDAGLWITTTTGEHGREQTDNYDAIYIGGGRILYTDDGWRTVSMSVGRAEMLYPQIDASGNVTMVQESKFGVFAEFLIAGYVGGSLIVGGDIYSTNYQTTSNKNTGNYGTHINLTDGTFEFNSGGKKLLTLNTTQLEVNGVIHASSGNIGSDANGDGGFIIANQKFYMTKDSFNSTSNGIYIGFDSGNPTTQGISLGAYSSTTNKNPFSVDANGKLTSTSGYIGGFTITNNSLYFNKTTFNGTTNGLYIGFDGNDAKLKGISLGQYNATTQRNPFSVDINGKLTSTSGLIGGFNITNKELYNGKTSFTDATNTGIFLSSAQGIALGKYDSTTSRNPFSVDMNGYLTSTSGLIGGFNITSGHLSNGKGSLGDSSEGVYLGTDGISLGANSVFKVTKAGKLNASNAEITGKITSENADITGKVTATSGKIGNWNIDTNTISAGNVKLDSSDEKRISVTSGETYKFYVTNSGKLYSKEADIEGKITSVEGSIGGFTIKNGYLKYGKDSLGDSNEGVYLGTTGISLGKGDAFKVTAAGKLTATDANITGKITSSEANITGSITATSGYVGGWKITEKTITSGNVTLSSDGSGNDAIRMQVKSGETYKFYVTNGGKLYARDADIGGEITSEKGYIGGWKISSTTLSSLSEDHSDGITLESGNNKKILVTKYNETSQTNDTIFSASAQGIVWNAQNSSMDRYGNLIVSGRSSTITSANIQTKPPTTGETTNARIYMDDSATLKGAYGGQDVNYLDMAQENATDHKYHMNLIASNALNIMTPMVTVGTQIARGSKTKETINTGNTPNQRITYVRKIYYNPSNYDPEVTRYNEEQRKTIPDFDLYNYMDEGYVALYSRSDDGQGGYIYSIRDYINCTLPVMLVNFGDYEAFIHGMMVDPEKDFTPIVNT